MQPGRRRRRLPPSRARPAPAHPLLVSPVPPVSGGPRVHQRARGHGRRGQDGADRLRAPRGAGRGGRGDQGGAGGPPQGEERSRGAAWDGKDARKERRWSGAAGAGSEGEAARSGADAAPSRPPPLLAPAAHLPHRRLRGLRARPPLLWPGAGRRGTRAPVPALRRHGPRAAGPRSPPTPHPRPPAPPPRPAAPQTADKTPENTMILTLGCGKFRFYGERAAAGPGGRGRGGGARGARGASGAADGGAGGRRHAPLGGHPLPPP